MSFTDRQGPFVFDEANDSLGRSLSGLLKRKADRNDTRQQKVDTTVQAGSVSDEALLRPEQRSTGVDAGIDQHISDVAITLLPAGSLGQGLTDWHPITTSRTQTSKISCVLE